MKTFLGLVALVTTAFAFNIEVAKQMKQKAISEIEACAKEVSASSSDVADIFAHITPSTHNGKCIFFCFYKIYSVLDDDGNLCQDKIAEKIKLFEEMDPDLAMKIATALKNCESTPSDTDPCIFASNLAACVRKEKEEVGLKEFGFA